MGDAGRSVEKAADRAARVSYGRRLSLLASRSRDIAKAEDALSEAFMAVLNTWPRSGVPDNADAWLLTAARNHLKNMARHQEVVDASAFDLLLMHDEAARKHRRSPTTGSSCSSSARTRRSTPAFGRL